MRNHYQTYLHSINDVIVEPSTRNFIVASVGSGKSTLGCVILDKYHEIYPNHRIYIVDYKRRFFSDSDNDHARLFPYGTHATIMGRREGVIVNGKLGNHPAQWIMPRGGVRIIQDEESAEYFCEWIFNHHDIRRPVLIYFDETFDIMGSGHRANPALRRIIQMGRELGIGLLLINQRPSWIDRTFMTEADVIYYGQLHSRNDRLYVLEETAVREKFGIDDSPVPPFCWWKINQKNPDESFYFTLDKAA